MSNLNQPWFSPQCLQGFCNNIHQKGAALSNCWGFVDGTVRPISRTNENKKILYNGHKKVHAIEFQSVVSPNGLVANLYGPVDGKRHNSGMLTISTLLDALERYSVSPYGHTLCIYGDPACPLRPCLQAPFRGAVLTTDQQAWNKSVKEVRVSVGWIFDDIINYFKFLDFKKDLKIGLGSVGKMYIVCALLRNARTILYGNTTSQYFDINPPMLGAYFI